MRSVLTVIAATFLFSSMLLAEMIYPPPPEIPRHGSFYLNPDATVIEVRVRDLVRLKGIDRAGFNELEGVIIKLSADPRSSDEEKEKLIRTFLRGMRYLRDLSECPSFRYLVVAVGDYTFIRKSDGMDYDADREKNATRARRLNLERARERLGPKLERVLPGVPIYAFNWGW